MLKNLKDEMKKKNLKIVALADFLGYRYQTVSDKLSGKSEFKVNEAIKIRDYFFPEFRMSYLFKTEQSKENY